MKNLKKVVLLGVPGMKTSDIIKMERYIKEEYKKDLDFQFISESVLSKEDLIQKVQGAEVLISWDQEMDDELYSSLNLKAYCAASIGFNAANIKSATKNKVLVTNVANYCVDEVASHTISLILALYRKMNILVPDVENGQWSLEKLSNISRFEDSTVGLLGFGSIPRAVSKKLSGFGVRIIAYDPFVDAKSMKALGVDKVGLKDLFENSDYLSLHTPLTKDTYQIVNKSNLKLMKNTAYIINTARGGLINQDDLENALNKGLIQGAGLDVLEIEPPGEKERRLINMKNTIVTPHSAYVSSQASDLQIRTTAKIVSDLLNNKIPINVKNPEIIENLTWSS